MLKEGTNAPDFSLLDQEGEIRSLSQYKDGWVLLYFYPKDDTPGCIKEACGIRDRFSKYQRHGIAVLGVSADSEESHAKFEKKFQLPFRLLSDTDKSVLKKYGVWQEKNFMGKSYMGIVRTSFLIDPTGKIRKIYENVDPEIHAGQVLDDVVELKKQA